MLPTVILTADEAIRMVPGRMKEAAIGIGCTPTQVVCKVVLPTALPGILTGIMLGIARVAGEFAPLLFTALFSNFWLSSLFEPTASPVDPDLQLLEHADPQTSSNWHGRPRWCWC